MKIQQTSKGKNFSSSSSKESFQSQSDNKVYWKKLELCKDGKQIKQLNIARRPSSISIDEPNKKEIKQYKNIVKNEHPLKTITTATWNNIPACIIHAIESIRKQIIYGDKNMFEFQVKSNQRLWKLQNQIDKFYTINTQVEKNFREKVLDLDNQLMEQRQTTKARTERVQIESTEKVEEVTREVKMFDDKLNDFILDVRSALARLENNLIELNQVTTQKIEKQMVVNEDSQDEQSLSNQKSQIPSLERNADINLKDEFRKKYLKNYTIQKFKSLEPMITQNFENLKEEILRVQDEMSKERNFRQMKIKDLNNNIKNYEQNIQEIEQKIQEFQNTFLNQQSANIDLENKLQEKIDKQIQILNEKIEDIDIQIVERAKSELSPIKMIESSNEFSEELIAKIQKQIVQIDKKCEQSIVKFKMQIDKKLKKLFEKDQLKRQQTQIYKSRPVRMETGLTQFTEYQNFIQQQKIINEKELKEIQNQQKQEFHKQQAELIKIQIQTKFYNVFVKKNQEFKLKKDQRIIEQQAQELKNLSEQLEQERLKNINQKKDDESSTDNNEEYINGLIQLQVDEKQNQLQNLINQQIQMQNDKFENQISQLKIFIEQEQKSSFKNTDKPLKQWDSQKFAELQAQMQMNEKEYNQKLMKVFAQLKLLNMIVQSKVQKSLHRKKEDDPHFEQFQIFNSKIDEPKLTEFKNQIAKLYKDMKLHVDFSVVQDTIQEIEKTIKNQELNSINLSEREVIEMSEHDATKDSKLKTVTTFKPNQKVNDFKNIDDIVLSEIDIDSSAVSKVEKTLVTQSIDKKMKIDNFCQNLYKYEWNNNDKKQNIINTSYRGQKTVLSILSQNTSRQDHKFNDLVEDSYHTQQNSQDKNEIVKNDKQHFKIIDNQQSSNLKFKVNAKKFKNMEQEMLKLNMRNSINQTRLSPLSPQKNLQKMISYFGQDPKLSERMRLNQFTKKQQLIREKRLFSQERQRDPINQTFSYKKEQTYDTFSDRNFQPLNF